MEHQTLEIIFGAKEADHIRFEVRGPTCPHAKEDWYRAQLEAGIHIHVGEVRGYGSLVMFSDDFHLFRERLTILLSQDTGGAWLETGDTMSVYITAAGSTYEVWLQLDALDGDGEMLLCEDGEENWEFRLTLGHGSVEALLAAVTRVSERYPVWSTPRT